MLHFDWKILPLLFLLPFCKNSQAPEHQLIVSTGQASLRAEPSEKSREMASLQRGQTLADLGEVSRFESQMAVGDHLYQAPWIMVETPENEKGWVLASALRPIQKREDWLLQKRLACYFGKGLAARRNVLLQALTNLETEEELANAWRESNTLRDTFLTMLMRRPESGFQLQFDWLNEVLAGFLFQKVGVGNRPYLFANFGIWQQKSLKTNGLQDDAFFQTCLMAFPQDSIESFFPAWKFQLSDAESASQLGTGQHLKMLQQIDLAMRAGPLFAQPLETFKDEISEDIFSKSIRYWQPQEKILEELAHILAHPPKCLNTREREALGIRKKMFEDPERNGIVVNLRSGG